MIVSAEQLHGTIIAPLSKSALHRRLILNRIAGVSDVPDNPCYDISATSECLNRLGKGLMLDCRESGSTLRFLLPVSLLFGGGSFTGDASLRLRPIRPLLDVLRAHGAGIDSDVLPITVRGTLQSGTYVLDGGISSQFFSGLLMTLPFLPGESTLVWTSPLGSEGYVKLTERMLREHGVDVVPIENGYRIPGGQIPKALPPTVEGDWSSAAAMLILGAISGSVTVAGLNPDSEQPDRQILSVLEQCGARIRIDGDAVTVQRSKLRGFKFNGETAPDLVPVLSALGCAVEGDSVLYRLNRLRYKESDRFDALKALLRTVGADFESDGETVVIHGNGAVAGGAAEIPSDHRMVMAAALLSACAASPITIPHADCVGKSYPAFFRDFVKLGGHIDAV